MVSLNEANKNKAVAANAIKTLTIVGWATTARGQPLSLRLSRQDPPSIVPVRAWRGEILPNGPPSRPPSKLPPPTTNELSVTVAEPLGSGRCGNVLAVDTLRLTDPNDRKVRLLYPQAPHLPELVIKIAAGADHEAALRHEAAMYDEMESLQGISIPRAYGLFSADIPAGTVVPGVTSSRISILLLERQGELLPLGDKLPEEGDLWDVFRDLARLGIEHTEIRYSDILHAPNPEYGLPAIPCPYHRCVHTYRVVDFGSAQKTDLTLKRLFFNTAAFLGPMLEGMKNNVILEPWDIKGNVNTANRPSAL